MKPIVSWTSLGLVGLLQACGNPFNISSNCDNGFYTTDGGQLMQWPDGSRVELQMDKSVPAEMRDVVTASGDRYNDVFAKTRLKIIDSETINPPAFNGSIEQVSGDGTNGIYWVDEAHWAWGKSDPQAVAMTVVSFSTSDIAEADVFFRAKEFIPTKLLTATSSSLKVAAGMPLDFLLSFRLSPTFLISSAAYDDTLANPQPIEHHVFMVSVHEMGHVIGRCHSKDPDSIMYPEVGAGTVQTREHPLSIGDLSILSQAYKL